MTKNIAIVTVALIIIITVAVLGFVWDRKATVDNPVIITTTKQSTNNATKDNVSSSTDSDTKAVENDLDSISDDNFSENNLSDLEMGL
jgi:hypothetical protein